MKSSWTSGLEKELAHDIKVNFVDSLVTRKRLTQLLELRAEESRRVCRSKVSYDSHNWAYLQADQNGYERALLEIIELVK